MKKSLYVLFTCMFFLTGCNKDKIIGTWVQPIPGMEGQTQGIRLNSDGSAESVNMYTLLYQNWTRKGNLLTLSGKSIGNGQSFQISEEFKINKLDEKTLILQLGDSIYVYSKQNLKKDK